MLLKWLDQVSLVKEFPRSCTSLSFKVSDHFFLSSRINFTDPGNAYKYVKMNRVSSFVCITFSLVVLLYVAIVSLPSNRFCNACKCILY